jgi:WD repeat-containing protein 19
MLDWDYENEYLGILLEGLPYVFLWSPFTTNFIEELHFENQKNKATWLKWSKTHPVLTFGNEKGYVNFYFKKNKKKIPTMGKHSKKVVSGDWNDDGLLATGSEDRIITISNHTSDNMFNSIALRSEPHTLKWINMKTEERNQKQTAICAVLGHKTLLIHDLAKDGGAQTELMFEDKYGKIIDYHFFGDGYIIVGFSEGYYCHVSTHAK